MTVKNKKSKEHDFYNKPWEAWIRVTKHDSVTGQSDASLADAEFSVYEYQKETGSYEPYHYEDRKLMTDREDGTYEVGPLYYNPSNEGRFMILETRSPYGYTIDRKTNRFFIQITGEQTIMLTEGNAYNQAGTYPAASDAPARSRRLIMNRGKSKFGQIKEMRIPERNCRKSYSEFCDTTG